MPETAATVHQTTHALHGHFIRVRTEEAMLADAAKEALGDIAAPGEADGAELLEVVLHPVERTAQLPHPSAASQFVAKVPQAAGAISCTLLKDGGRWLLDFENLGLFSLDLAAGRVEGWLVEPHRLDRKSVV